MGMTWRWVVGGVLSFSVSGWGTFVPHAAFDRPPLVSAADIDGWLKATDAPKTVEGFLKRLPAAYRGHFTLMYSTGSLHRATPDYPRTIYFGPDSRLLTAVSSDPTDPRREIVELIEFNPKTARFTAHEIDFKQASPRLNNEPRNCAGCHGHDLRPNWEPYDAWPGAYGSVHDKMAAGTHENGLFSKFLDRMKSDLRFGSLPENFLVQQSNFGGSTTYYTASRGTGSNSTFSLMVSFANRERLTRIMVESPDFASYRSAVTSALLGCPESPEETLPAALKKNHPRSFASVLDETQKLIARDHDRRVRRTAFLQQIKDDEETMETFRMDVDRFGLRDRETTRVAKLRYLFENREVNSIPMDRWTNSVFRDSYQFNDGVSGLENLIGQYVPSAYPSRDPLRAKIIYKTIPYEVTSFSEEPAHHTTHPDGFKLELYESPDPSAELCQSLKAE